MTCEYGVPCPELNGKVLSGRTWDIYQGKAEGMTEAECEVFRQFWAGKIPAETATMVQQVATGAIIKSLCIHLGEWTGELRDCPSCKGNVREKIHECRIYGKCSIGRQLTNPQIACCVDCPSYKPS